MSKADRILSERLIEEVRKRRLLYDTKFPDFRDKGKADMEWRKVAEVLNLPVDVVRRKWQHILYCYTKSLNSSYNQYSGPTEFRKVYTFYLFDKLDFLREHMSPSPGKDRAGISAATLEPGESEDEVVENLGQGQSQSTRFLSSADGCYGSYAAPAISEVKAKKRKSEPPESASDLDTELLKYIESRADQPSDVVMDFFKGLAPQVRQLSKVRQRKLFHLISSNLFELLNEQEEEAAAEQTKSTTIVKIT